MAQAVTEEQRTRVVGMTDKLVSRLEEIPGVDFVAVDLTDIGGGISVRLEPGADEELVMEKVRQLLVAYGVRSADPKVKLGRTERFSPVLSSFDVDVSITPLRSGARVEVAGKNVRSFRVVPANPAAIAQGISDAWCQVIGRIPVEIVKVAVGDSGQLTIVASDGQKETVGTADVSIGWEQALGQAVGEALGQTRSQPLGERRLTSNSS